MRVHRGGVKVIARRGVGASTENGPVRFETSTCEVSPKDHPYPWEPKSVRTIAGDLMYREDFSDPKSGWPNRREQVPAPPRASLRGTPEGEGGEYRPGLRYVPGGYQVSHHPPADLVTTGPIADGTVAAYGPSWDNLRAAVSVETNWKRTFRPLTSSLWYSEVAPGLVFHLSADGYYALVLTGGVEQGTTTRILNFKLVRKLFGEDNPGQQSELIPWTPIVLSDADVSAHKMTVEYRNGQISVMVDDLQVTSIHDDRLPSGLVGMAVFGKGDAIFHDLLVEGLP